MVVTESSLENSIKNQKGFLVCFIGNKALRKVLKSLPEYGTSLS